MLTSARVLFFGAVLLLLGLGTAPVYAATADTTWGLVWSDECNGAAGTAPDASKWNLVNQGGGFGNNELEYYTNRTANSYYDGNGNLVIKTMKESYSGSNYTSAKLYSRNKGDWTYCKSDIRARLPKGRCVWPAFWMMPTSSPYGGWPVCGEIDIMEERGDNPGSVGSTIHFGNPWKYIGQSYSLPSKQTFDTAYHNFGMEWEAGTIRFYVDNILFETRVNTEWYCSGANKTTNPYAPFDVNFYMQLNTAVGGPNTPYTGNQNVDDSVFPQYMYVDYVRIYKRGAPSISAALPRDMTPAAKGVSGTELTVFSQGFLPASTRLRLAPGSQAASVSIYTMRGDLVRTLDVTVQNGNSARVVWNGKTGNGRAVTAGTYVVAAAGGAAGMITLGR
jgi:beta-glucanase (GH16 family)